MISDNEFIMSTAYYPIFLFYFNAPHREPLHQCILAGISSAESGKNSPLISFPSLVYYHILSHFIPSINFSLSLPSHSFRDVFSKHIA